MKIFSIAFQSLIHPERFSMYSAIASTMEEAYRVGLQRMIAEQGDLAWRPLMQTLIVVDISQSKEPNINTTQTIKPERETKSWIMKTIVDNKDGTLYKSSKKYLSKPEQLFIEEKINDKK